MEEKECSTTTFNLKAFFLSANDLWQLWEKYNFQIVKIRSSPQRVPLWNGVLQVYSKFTWEHWFESFFLIKLYSNFIEITDTSAWVFSCKVAVRLQNIISLWGASSKECSYLLQIIESHGFPTDFLLINFEQNPLLWGFIRCLIYISYNLGYQKLMFVVIINI